MKVIVDTNVLVSAILRDNLPERVIMWIVMQPVIEWIATAEIIQEYKEVLQRKKFNLPNNIIQRWLELLENEIVLVFPQLTIDFPRDRKDAKFLTCAIASQADIFITGDRDFEEARPLIKTQIMSITQFKLLMEF
jgi:putative PIN family toxin of toxin-antitoxin system